MEYYYCSTENSIDHPHIRLQTNSCGDGQCYSQWYTYTPLISTPVAVHVAIHMWMKEGPGYSVVG